SGVEEGPVSGPVALTPIQRWFVEQDLAEAQHFTQSALVELGAEVDATALGEAVAAVVEHHDALRLRVRRGAQGWEQEIAAAQTADCLERVDLSGVDPAEQSRRIEDLAERVRRDLDLPTGPRRRSV